MRAAPGIVLISGIVAAGVVWPAPAQYGPDWYLAPSGRYTFSDDGRAADDGGGIALALGYRPSLATRFEAELASTWMDRPSASIAQSRLQVSALRFFGTAELFSPYFRFATGLAHSSEFDTNVVGGLGIGFESSLSFLRSAFRSEIRFSQEYASETHDDWSLTAGINVPVGSVSHVARLATNDRDGDGVSDLDDRCARTVRAVAVDSNGCEFDADRDGVVDRIDHCAGTVRGATVNSRGCEPDSDRDGITNRIDRCPGTDSGLAVNEIGCARDSDLDEAGDLPSI